MVASKRHTPRQIINKLRQAEVEIANGATIVQEQVKAPLVSGVAFDLPLPLSLRAPAVHSNPGLSCHLTAGCGPSSRSIVVRGPKPKPGPSPLSQPMAA